MLVTWGLVHVYVVLVLIINNVINLSHSMDDVACYMLHVLDFNHSLNAISYTHTCQVLVCRSLGMQVCNPLGM
jgi:hypothetical protein